MKIACAVALSPALPQTSCQSCTALLGNTVLSCSQPSLHPTTSPVLLNMVQEDRACPCSSHGRCRLRFTLELW